MKLKPLITLFGLFIGFTVLAQDPSFPSPLVLDYQYEYFWDETNNNWSNSGVWTNPNRIQYFYDESGYLTEILVYNKDTRENVRRTLYHYDLNENKKEQIDQIWGNDVWKNYRRDVYSYNQFDQVIELIIQFWIADIWTNSSRRQEYVYNGDGQMIQFSQQIWKNGTWIDEAIEQWSYSGNRLIERMNILADGTYRYRFSYTYNDVENSSEFIYQIWNRSQWLNRTHRISFYNDCGNVYVQFLQQWENEEWENDRKTEYFFTFNSSLKKIPICHKGHIILISKNDVEAHFRHGDCIGECINENKLHLDNREIEGFKNIKPLFTIYPNPAKEWITLRFNENLDYQDRNEKIIELTDFYGKLIKSYKVKDGGELIISRGGLMSGRYFLKLIGEDVFSVMVIFD